MGKAILPAQAKIIAGFIFSDYRTFNKAVSHLSKKLGPVDTESDSFQFNHTDYYCAEMGQGLIRRFVAFKRLRGLDNIYMLKLITNNLEMRLSPSVNRSINIDPGYLTASSVILLTTKNYTHRIYLKNGIFAETTLFFKNGSYQPWEWTFPDFKTEEYIKFFNTTRASYLNDLKCRDKKRFNTSKMKHNICTMRCPIST